MVSVDARSVQDEGRGHIDTIFDDFTIRVIMLDGVLGRYCR